MGAIDPALASDASDVGTPKQIPPISQALPQPGPAMQTLQPQHPEQYRALPPPQHMYNTPYPQQQMAYSPSQPAPRQRTAIACRYCRRRKIRCSGFDQAEDGRCTNCVRFSQDCVFTPVSAGAQAFVPAHTVWRGQNPPANAQLYGAYGQPLPPHGTREAYAQQPGQPVAPPAPQPSGQYPPPPPTPQGFPQQPNIFPQAPPPAATGQKRASDEPHTPTMAPPHPGTQAHMSRDASFAYTDPSLTQPEHSDGAPSSDNVTPANGSARVPGSAKSAVVDAGVQVNLPEDDGGARPSAS